MIKLAAFAMGGFHLDELKNALPAEVHGHRFQDHAALDCELIETAPRKAPIFSIGTIPRS